MIADSDVNRLWKTNTELSVKLNELRMDLARIVGEETDTAIIESAKKWADQADSCLSGVATELLKQARRTGTTLTV